MELKPKGEITRLLMERLQQREQQGIETYGEPLRPHNGRSALQDALDEALDLAAYLQQEILERADEPKT